MVAKILGAPLAEALTLYTLAVAVGGEDGLQHPGPGQVVGKDFIHQIVNVFKDISPIDPFLIVGGGGRNGKVIALISVRRNRE